MLATNGNAIFAMKNTSTRNLYTQNAMKLILERYFGNKSITKSALTVMSEEGKELMKCEAREPRYKNYTDAFTGCSVYCLAEGTFPCKPVSARQSPMTLTIIKSPGHRCCRFGWDELEQMRTNFIYVGEADEGIPPEIRQIHHQRETFDRLTKWVYRAYGLAEPITLTIKNDAADDRT